MKTFKSSSIIKTATLGLAISFCAAAGAETVSAPAEPDAAVDVRSISIHYARAELSTENGRAELHSKLRQAAREVCGSVGLRETGSLSIWSRNRKCYEAALAAAISQVDSDQMAATGF